MEIINLFKNYEFQNNDSLSQYHYWLKFMDQFDEIKRICMDDYLLNNYNPKEFALEKVFVYSKDDFDKMKDVSNRMEEICFKLKHFTTDLIDTSKMPLVVIIYHGLANAAGWATKYKGKPAMLFGVEKIVELGWTDDISLENLIYHEYAHLIHEQIRDEELEPFSDNYRAWINRVYIEGFATYLESVFSGTIRRREWHKACQAKEDLLKKELFDRLNDQLSCQDFFGDWYQVHGLTDTGYYLGHQYIKSLLNLYDLKNIARLPFNKIEDSFLRFLNGKKLIK